MRFPPGQHWSLNVEPVAYLDLDGKPGMGRLHFIRSIALPNALPEIFAGMRVSLAIALIITVVAEMRSSRPGLGQMILFAARGFRSAEIAGVFLLGALGYLGNAILQRAEAHFLRWRPDASLT